METRFKPLFFAFIAIGFCLINVSAQTTCTVSVNQAQSINLNAKKLLGISFDGRSSMDYNAGSGPVVPAGYYNPTTGAMLPSVQSIWNRVPMGGVRYPGNLEILNWNWSYTVGPYANRIAQPCGTSGAQSQKLQFGFDEFMAMTASKGLASSDVQIMVNIYPSVGQPNPAVLAADWVEYCNALDNGTNIRHNTDWAHLRAIYRNTPTPYGVKIWNMGNEPWSGSEFGNLMIYGTLANGANAYINTIIPIIDSMLVADPTIRITIPALGNISSPWNSTLLASNALMSRIYAFCIHSFYDEDNTTTNPSISQVETLIKNVATNMPSGKKVVAGDHAHNAPTTDYDKAMQWQGALATADYLLMLSQVGNVELANFWIYGNVKAQWHPIRQNADGSYTLMAAAQLYESFYPVFYDQSLTTTISNSIGGSSVASTRASAFKANDGSYASILVVNTNLVNDNEIIPPTMTGFTLQSVNLISANSINDDTSTTSISTPLGNGNYASPHASVLVFKYNATGLPVRFAGAIKAVEVPEGIKIDWATVSEQNNSHFEVEHSNDAFVFNKIGYVNAQENNNATHHYEAIDSTPHIGINYYRVKQVDTDGKFDYSRIVSIVYQYNDLTLYPNPTNHTLTISSHDVICHIVIKNIMGAIVKVFDEPSNIIDITDLIEGVYLVELTTNQAQIVTRKIIKQ